jgi:nucleotide-binding universal stress UspA family protein
MTNSYRQLLVHIDDTERAAVRLALARRIASAQGAAASALYATRPAYEMALVGPDVLALVIEELARLDEDRLLAAKRRFDAMLAEPGPQVTWGSVRDIGLAATFAGQALYADLLVLGQRRLRNHSAGRIRARPVRPLAPAREATPAPGTYVFQT